MYESYYGVRERPFDLTPNPKFLLLTSKHREALSNLHYGLTSRRALTLLIGDAGTGKTTLVRAAVGEFEKHGAVIAYLNNPTLNRGEFYEFLAGAFGCDPSAAGSKVRLLKELATVLQERSANGVLAGLVIDEAQSLPDDLLEEVRLLANIETPTEKLLPVVLAGQPELAERLNHATLRQLKQRVSLRCLLGALDARETGEYIAARIRVAGGNSALVFTRQAVDAVFEHSGGIPRLISVICDNAMISGFAADRRPVSRDIVEDVCRDFDLPGRNGTPVLSQHDAAKVGTTVVPLKPSAPRGSHTDRSLFEHFSARRRFSFF